MSARDKVISVRLTDAQHASLLTLAEQMHCSVSDLIRRQIDSLSRPAFPLQDGGTITVSGLPGATWWQR